MVLPRPIVELASMEIVELLVQLPYRSRVAPPVAVMVSSFTPPSIVSFVPYNSIVPW